ncbi:MAG: tRNA dihydrouridine synthase [Chloroflexota bacterium]
MQPVFHVREIPIYGDLVLAPMDGYSDQPFRSLCRGLGSAMSYTEFINAIDVTQKHPHLEQKLAFTPTERPVVYQIFDSDPERLLQAALKLAPRGPDIIDVNMGCSDKSVSGRGAGAGLLREPAKIARIFALLTKNLPMPVTGKIRLGWDDGSRNYLEVARIIEDNGGSLVAVHGRTKQQAYGGQADWDAIAEVKAALKIPVIGNGDVQSVADIERIKAHTGCDAVMIARAAVHNPWIFSRLDRADVPPALLRATMLDQLQRMLDFYGSPRGLVLFRKFASRYLAPLGLSTEQRRALLTAETPADFLQLLASLHP